MITGTLKNKSIAFIYDHRYYRSPKNEVFSAGPMGQEAWKRYLEVAKEVVVVGTVEDVDNEEKLKNLNRSDLPRVQFFSLPYINRLMDFIKNFVFINKNLEQVLKEQSAIVARLPGELGYNAIRIAKKYNIPYWTEVVGCPWDAYWNHGNVIGKILAPISYFRMRRVIKRSEYVLYVTRFFLQKRYPTNGRSINASNVYIPDLDEQVLEYKRNLLKNEKEQLVLGVIGSFDVKYKGHTEILKALAIVKDKIPPYVLRMVGPGNSDWIYEMAGELGLRENIEIVGKLKSGKQINDFLDTLHLYIHPSRQEGLPRAVIEAMSRACPVLGSTTGGIPELLSENFLHNTGNFKQLAEQLKLYLNEKNKLIEACAVNFNKAKQYEYSRLNKRRISFFQSILD